MYRSERDISQIQPDQQYTPITQPDQKLYNRTKNQTKHVPNQGETMFLFLEKRFFIQIWHIYRHILLFVYNNVPVQNEAK